MADEVAADKKEEKKSIVPDVAIGAAGGLATGVAITNSAAKGVMLDSAVTTVIKTAEELTNEFKNNGASHLDTGKAIESVAGETHFELPRNNQEVKQMIGKELLSKGSSFSVKETAEGLGKRLITHAKEAVQAERAKSHPDEAWAKGVEEGVQKIEKGLPEIVKVVSSTENKVKGLLSDFRSVLSNPITRPIAVFKNMRLSSQIGTVAVMGGIGTGLGWLVNQVRSPRTVIVNSPAASHQEKVTQPSAESKGRE